MTQPRTAAPAARARLTRRLPAGSRRRAALAYAVSVAGGAALDQAARLGTVVGDSQPVMKQALQQYFRMGFWTVNGSGMPEANINHMIAVQIAVGNLKQSTAPAYAQIVDQSVYQQAAKLAS